MLAGDVPRPNSKAKAVIKTGQPVRVTDDTLEDFAKVLARWDQGIGLQPTDSISAVDNFADMLVQTISDAIRATRRRMSAKKGRTV